MDENGQQNQTYGQQLFNVNNVNKLDIFLIYISLMGQTYIVKMRRIG